MTQPPFDVDAVAAAYRKAKAYKDDLEAQTKAVSADLEKLKEMLHNHMINHSLTSLKTNAGDSMHFRQSTRFSSGDWTHFKAWVLLHPDAIDLFESRLHQGNTAIWLKENEGNPELVPPGLTSHTSTTLVIKPAKE